MKTIAILCFVLALVSAQPPPANYKYAGYLYFLREFYRNDQNCDLLNKSATDASIVCEHFNKEYQVSDCKSGVMAEHDKRYERCNPPPTKRTCWMYGRRAGKLAYADVCDTHFYGKTYNKPACYDWALDKCKISALPKINRAIKKNACDDVEIEFTSYSITPICEFATKKMLGMPIDVDDKV